MNDFNAQVIDEFRSNNGVVTTAGFGDNLILLHTLGAKSGEPRVNPLLAVRDGHSWLLIGSAGGSPATPAWVHNLRATSDVRVEAPGPDGIRTVPVSVAELRPDEWEQAWAKFTRHSPSFVKYTETSEGRRFPIFRITPTT
ncbi:nitroreductase/quinone reductase family protein [Gordonia sp. ABSL1-1]|uniref:nitroreductase/quinone reductase family protein n=1 Tax=Gordonia sp. ABSL1-1 TaxID=3053923 RepID=UPI002574685F|nr:nitroreductase/quinone reductase family protein [Gordonia sp. ABSL1-1]MDL9938917.1 nitroreductase/quinone reductase family protein [Gordonia sp. ABSL1-1]